MKPLVVLLVVLLWCLGCRSSTAYGPCIGLNQQPDTALTYEYSARNIFWGLAGAELIYPPIKVLLDENRCPVSRHTRRTL